MRGRQEGFRKQAGVSNAPHAVTVVAPTCVQAGMLSTLALMMGAGAEAFLDEQGIQYWSVR